MIKSLASLRFVFAFLVFLHHIKLMEDAIGHAFFFMLSGFILSYVYGDRVVQHQISTIRFLKLRFSRLYPVYFITLLLAVPLYSINYPWEPVVFWSKFTATVFLVQSFVPDNHYYFSFNGLAWSISDLFFFYALFPLIFKWFHQLKLSHLIGLFGVAFVVLLSLMCSIPEEYIHFTFYVNPFFRLFDFGLGILVYKGLIAYKGYQSKTFNTLFELTAIFTLTAFYYLSDFFPKVLRYSLYYWLPMLLFMVAFARQRGSISAILSHPILLFLGELSLGFYIYHQLVLRYVGVLNNKYALIEEVWLLNTLTFVLILVICYISYYSFENPLKNFLRKVLLSENNRN
ncbi:MAG: acyltransferase [Leeuwenhoekiella sp.]